MKLNALDLPDEKAKWIKDELHRDEAVRWSGEPVPAFFSPGVLPRFLFAIPWTAFAVFWTTSAYAATHAAEAPGFDVFPLFGIPFVLIGLGMLSAPLRNRMKLARTAYAVTDRRLLVVAYDLFGKRSVRSFERTDLASVRREEGADGTGDLFFAQDVGHGKHGTYSIPVGFVGVRNVRAAEDAVRALSRSPEA